MAKKIIKDGDKGTKLISVLNKNLEGKMNDRFNPIMQLFMIAKVT